MKELKGSKTEANLMAAFAGESQAHVKYNYFASQAKKDGYEQMGAIFEETAHNEKEHAKIWFKLLHNGMPKTPENLAAAAAGEHFEWETMYADFAREAKEEGFAHIAKLFEGVAKVEKGHEERYLTLLGRVEDNLVFQAGEQTVWVCRNCGHVSVGAEPPEICPVCAHPRAFFERSIQNY